MRTLRLDDFYGVRIAYFIAAALYNPNIICDEYSACFAEAEIEAVAMLANLVGYDREGAEATPSPGGGAATLIFSVYCHLWRVVFQLEL